MSCGKWEVEPEVVFSQVVRHVQDERPKLDIFVLFALRLRQQQRTMLDS